MNMKKITCLLSLSLCLSVGAGTKAKAAVTPERIGGASRYDTSIAVSRNGWNATSDYAVIANGEDFGDALSAAPLAKKYNAPILLVSKDKLDNGSDTNNISSELLRLKVKKVFLIGGTESISQNVEDMLNNEGVQVERIAGKDRYDTSIQIAKKVGTDSGIVLASGDEFADALSIAPIAAAKGMPLILVPKDGISSEETDYINSNRLSKVYVMGGTDIISDDIVKQFNTVERITGDNEYQRNLNVLDKFSKDIDYDTVYLASTNGFADALSGSALAALTSSPIILVSENSETSFENYIKDKINNIGQVNVLGGEGVVKSSLLADILPVTTSQAIDSGLLKASENEQNITSLESDCTLGINASAKDLPEQGQQVADSIVKGIDNSKMSFNIKMNNNSKKTINNLQEDISMQIGGMNIQTTAWVATDFSTGQPKIKEVIKMPEMAAPFLPKEFAGKQYMVIDPVAMSSQLSPGTNNFNSFTDFSRNFQPQFQSFMNKYAESWNPGVKFITYKGLTAMNTKNGLKYAQTYELKLDDATLKTILNYTANDFVQNKDAINFVKQFMMSCIDLSAAPDKDAQKQQMEKTFDDMAANPEASMKQIQAFMDAIKDLKVIGDKGIDITYNICDGYIIGESGTVDLQLDLHKFIEVMNKLNGNTDNKTAEEVKGIIGLAFNYTTENYNINKDVNVQLPLLTNDNSFDYMDLIKSQIDSQQPVKVN